MDTSVIVGIVFSVILAAFVVWRLVVGKPKAETPTVAKTQDFPPRHPPGKLPTEPKD